MWKRSITDKLHSQACAVCATYLLAGTARLPALRGGACPGERTPGLSPGRASRETRCEGVSSALESRLSKAPCTPVLMPAGSLPGPPGSGVTSPARRNRTRSINWLSPADVPDVSETAAVMVIAAAKSKAVHLCRWINNFRAARFSERARTALDSLALISPVRRERSFCSVILRCERSEPRRTTAQAHRLPPFEARCFAPSTSG